MPSPIAPLVRLGGVVVALATIATDARAAFQAKMTGADPDLSVQVKLNGNTMGPFATGQYNWQYQNGSGPIEPFMKQAGSVYTFQTFCIELTQSISQGTNYSYNVVNLDTAPSPGTGQGSGLTGMGPVRANMLQELFDKTFPTLFSGTTDVNELNLRAAAFQVAIWEIVFEMGAGGNPNPTPQLLNATTGNFEVTSSFDATVGSRANTYLANALGTNTANYGDYTATPVYQLRAISSPGPYGVQDQLVWWQTNPGDGNPVPAPAGLVLVASGVLPGLGLLRFRRRAAT